MSLSVTTKIPYGNADDILIEEEKDSATVYFAASPCDGEQSLWFCFRIKSNKKLKYIKLVLKHPYNMLMGSCELSNILPVVKKDNDTWQRIEQTYQFQTLPDGRYYISWVLKNPGKINDIALCYPYGITDVDSLVKDSKGYLKKDIIGLSTENRPLLRLSNDYSYPGEKKPGIYIVSRQHSGETPGSWVLDGFLRCLMNLKTSDIIVWAIPLSNIDGIEKGRYGKNYFPHDLNRSWGLQTLRHENLVIQRDIARWKERCTPVLGLDFHAPGGAEGDGAYFYTHAKETSPQIKIKENSWIKIISAKIGNTYLYSNLKKISKPEGNFKNLTALTFVDYFSFVLKIPALCLETPYGISKKRILTEKDYRTIGEKIALAIMEEIYNETKR